MAFPVVYGRLRSVLDEICRDIGRNVVIQTHDFPDHDAAAAAFGLARLLSLDGFSPVIFYRGRVRSHSLLSMLSELDIPLQQVGNILPAPFAGAPCILVDGAPGNANARPLTPLLVGVIDHHAGDAAVSCPFLDIRPAYGSSATIISEYFLEAGRTVDRGMATALLMGIQMDTDFLSRKVSPADLEAHHRLFFSADWAFGTRTVKASLSLKDIPSIKEAVNRGHSRGVLYFTTVPRNCSRELISILADFFLRFREISVTAIVELGGDQYHVSVRSREAALSAVTIVKKALAGLGEGGGHDHMAGGLIPAEQCPSEDELFDRFVQAVAGAEEK